MYQHPHLFSDEDHAALEERVAAERQARHGEIARLAAAEAWVGYVKAQREVEQATAAGEWEMQEMDVRKKADVEEGQWSEVERAFGLKEGELEFGLDGEEAEVREEEVDLGELV